MEVTAGLSLVLGYGTRGGLLIIDILMIVFILALTTASLRGVDVACGCFTLSLTAKKSAYSYLLRDFLILAGGVCLLAFEIRKPYGHAER